MEKKCLNCGQVFQKKASESIKYWGLKKFCSPKCRFPHTPGRKKVGHQIKCQMCSKLFYITKCHEGIIKNCSRKCHGLWASKFRVGPKSARWKGGVIVRDGYVLVRSPRHPHRNSIGYVYLHRLIMEEKIGRYLTKKEVVHHIDNNPSNNHPDNLMLFASNGEHRKYHGKK